MRNKSFVLWLGFRPQFAFISFAISVQSVLPSSAFFCCSFSFLRSNVIFTDLSFFTVMTAGLTKQSSDISVAFSRYPWSINRFNSFASCSWRLLELALLFVELFVLLLSSLSSQIGSLSPGCCKTSH